MIPSVPLLKYFTISSQHFNAAHSWTGNTQSIISKPKNAEQMRRWRGEFGRYRGFSHIVILSSRCVFNLAALQGGISLGYPRIGGFLLFPVHIGELWLPRGVIHWCAPNWFRDIISIVFGVMECRSDWWNNNSKRYLGIRSQTGRRVL